MRVVMETNVKMRKRLTNRWVDRVESDKYNIAGMNG